MAPADRTEEGRIILALDIASLIREYLPLRREGSHFTGECPFHDGYGRSLRVDPAGRSFACLSCGQSGNIVDFVVAYELVDRSEALMMLRDRISELARRN